MSRWSWLNIFKPNRPDERLAEPHRTIQLEARGSAITAASTSANLVIQQATTEFAKEIEEKAKELDAIAPDNK
jgi:hypothetical protein